MLNPAISEEYGGDVEIILNELVNRLGKELAYTCYVIPGSIKVINGTNIPHFIVTTSDKLDEIRSVVSGVMDMVEREIYSMYSKIALVR